MTKNLLRRLVKDRDGSVLLETALMITILLMLTFGIVDLGRVLYTENNLVSAAREGSRYAAVDVNLSSSFADTLAVKDTVIAHFSPFGGTAMTRAMISTTPQGGGPPAASMIVLVKYPFTWITPIPRLLRWTTNASFVDTLHAQAQFRYEQ